MRFTARGDATLRGDARRPFGHPHWDGQWRPALLQHHAAGVQIGAQKVEPPALQRQVPKGPLVAKGPRQVVRGQLAEQTPHVARVGMLVHTLFTYPRAHLAALPFRVERRLEDARPLRLLVVGGRVRQQPVSASTAAASAPQHYRTGALLQCERFESACCAAPSGGWLALMLPDAAISRSWGSLGGRARVYARRSERIVRARKSSGEPAGRCCDLC